MISCSSLCPKHNALIGHGLAQYINKEKFVLAHKGLSILVYM